MECIHCGCRGCSGWKKRLGFSHTSSGIIIYTCLYWLANPLLFFSHQNLKQQGGNNTCVTYMCMFWDSDSSGALHINLLLWKNFTNRVTCYHQHQAFQVIPSETDGISMLVQGENTTGLYVGGSVLSSFSTLVSVSAPFLNYYFTWLCAVAD